MAISIASEDIARGRQELSIQATTCFILYLLYTLPRRVTCRVQAATSRIHAATACFMPCTSCHDAFHGVYKLPRRVSCRVHTADARTLVCSCLCLLEAARLATCRSLFLRCSLSVSSDTMSLSPWCSLGINHII